MTEGLKETEDKADEQETKAEECLRKHAGVELKHECIRQKKKLCCWNRVFSCLVCSSLSQYCCDNAQKHQR